MSLLKRGLLPLAVLLVLPPCVQAEPLRTAPNDLPVYISKNPNPNDYTLFATNGSDGNWYVGYDTCWIKRLPAIPSGSYERAFLGARLGRMKLMTNEKNIWDKRPVPGAIYMSIASTTAWKKDASYLLTTTEDIPLEGDAETFVEGTGESQWVWTEIPLSAVNQKGDNFLALWSPTPTLVNASSSPILAASWSQKDQGDIWLTRNVRGAPPRTPSEIGMPISYFQPAMALKLIPKGSSHPIRVQVVDWKGSTPDRPKPVITARVEGEAIENVWLEYAPEGGQNWARSGRSLWKAPYILTVDTNRLPAGKAQLRVVARNIWEETAASSPFTVEISTTATRQ